MRILITNNTLARRAGSELYVRDLALGLAELGHEPFTYSMQLGEVAEEIRAAGLPAVDDLRQLSIQPDIIHGHHHFDSMAALAHFPQTPAIYVCHSATAWEERPPHFPRILRYVAVDYACRDRLLLEEGIAEDKVRLILNFVDLDRFKSRPPLPPKPRRALILSNQASDYTHIKVVREACHAEGIEVDVVGYGVARVCANPETILGNYDLVFAKGRSALEALAVGAAVILCDAIGAGEMVTRENVDRMRPLNFGYRTLNQPLSTETLKREIARYDPADAFQVSQFIRANCWREQALEELLLLYHEVIDEHRLERTQNQDAEWLAASAYLRGLAPRLREVQALKTSETELNLIKNSRSWRLITRYTKLKKRFVTFAQTVPPLLSRAPRANGNHQLQSSSKDVFSEIYRTRAWGSDESVSGPGSTVAALAGFKHELEALVNRLQIKSVLDAGCGDFNWMKHLDVALAQYVGIDVVPEIVAANRRAYASDTRVFLNLDMTSDGLPQADLILCRDCLVHFSYEDIFAALRNFRESKSAYLLTTTFPEHSENADIRSGDWRPLNLQRPPFNFPAPRELINEKRKLANGEPANKFLGLWRLEDLA